MIKSIAIKLVAKYATSAVQDAIEANAENVKLYSGKIGNWLGKLRLVTAFLERLAERLNDGELTATEATESVKELGILKDQVLA